MLSNGKDTYQFPPDLPLRVALFVDKDGIFREINPDGIVPSVFSSPLEFLLGAKVPSSLVILTTTAKVFDEQALCSKPPGQFTIVKTFSLRKSA